MGFAGDLYLLPRCTAFDWDSSYDCMLKYDREGDSWSREPFPETGPDGGEPLAVSDVTGATIDGSLLLLITPPSGDSVFARYDADGTWTWLGGIPQDMEERYGTLASDGDDAYLIGGLKMDPGMVVTGDSSAVYRIDAAEGAFEKVGALKTPRARPQVAYRDGSFAVSGGYASMSQGGGVSGMEIATVGEDGLTTRTVDFGSLVTETGELSFAPAALAAGFAAVGPESAEGDADTYLIGGDSLDSLTVSAYGKRASAQDLMNAAATAYQGALYVFAGTQNAPYRVFCATAMETAEQPGDYVAPEPLPVPDPEQTGGGDGGGDGGDRSEGVAVIPLASTGDETATTALAAGAAMAAAALAGAVAVAARRRGGRDVG